MSDLERAEGRVRPRVLIVNPNTSDVITERLASEARRVADGRADIAAVTAPYGAPVLLSPDDLERARAAVAQVISASRGFDAAIIGAFSDPGLADVQATAPVPVFGLGRSGLLRAAQDGRPFAIVTLGRRMRATIERAVAQVGLGSQVVALHFLEADAQDLAQERKGLIEVATAVLPDCIKAGAEAVLFGGAPFAGIEALLRGHQAISIVDGLTSAMQYALEARSLRHA